MATDDKGPTEEQITAANAAEVAKWEGDFKEEDLNVPYKHEAEDDKDDKKDGDNQAAEDDKGDSDKESDVEDTQTQVVAAPVTIADPGDYKPADYSFEVTLKDGKTTKVSTPEEAEKLADDPDNFETPKQLMDFINKQNKMNRNLDKDYEKWEAQHKTFTEQLEAETQRREQVDNYVSEFNYLVGKGLLPTVAKEYADADWSDPEVAKQPGVKEQMAIMSYMVKENKVRAAAGVKQLTSIVDTYNAYMQDTGRQKTEDDRKAAGEARKVAGAKVAGVSPAQQGSYVPKGIAVGNPNVLKRGASVWDN